MNTIVRYCFISLYALAGIFLLTELGIYIGAAIDTELAFVLYGVWIVVCFSGYYWLPAFFLGCKRVRKTILEEEEWLHPLMHELTLRSRIWPVPDLLILEKPNMDVFAIGRRTVVLSKGLLVQLSDQEIKAVLAHEYGHLKNRDTMAGSAFDIACFIPERLYRIIKTGAQYLKKWFWKKGGLPPKLLFVALTGFAYFQYPDLVILSLILFIFMKIFPYFNFLIMMIWCYLSRVHEYQQDGFAQSLGCGRHLKSALLKIDAMNPGTLVNRFTQFRVTHPMIYMRIRRLEWLEGLRAKT